MFAAPAATDDPLSKQLFEACEANNKDLVKELLFDKKANPNAGSNRKCPLLLSYLYNYPAISTLLIEAGANPNIRVYDGKIGSVTPLIATVFRENLELAKLLIERGAEVDAQSYLGTALHMATKQDCLSLVNLLLNANADTELTQNNSMTTPLHLARNLEIAKALIDKGANINAKCQGGATPLYWAVSNYNLELATLFIEAGADINLQSYNHWTPLDIATHHEHQEMAEKLIENGARLNIYLDKTRCPVEFFRSLSPILNEYHYRFELLTASEEELPKVCEKHAEELTKTDSAGKTILHVAVEKKNGPLIKILIQRCPELIMICDNTKRTAYNLINESKHPELASLFLLNKNWEKFARESPSTKDTVQFVIKNNIFNMNKQILELRNASSLSNISVKRG